MIIAIFLIVLGLIAGIVAASLLHDGWQQNWPTIVIGIIVCLGCISSGALAINNHYKNTGKEQLCIAEGFKWESLTQKCVVSLDDR